MKLIALSTLVAFVAAQLPCVLPVPTSNNISTHFAVQVLYPDNPIIHERRLNFWPAGGGDQHLYLGPTAGNPIGNLTLVNGVITTSMNGGPLIRAVINGEVCTVIPNHTYVNLKISTLLGTIPPRSLPPSVVIPGPDSMSNTPAIWSNPRWYRRSLNLPMVMFA